MFANVTRLARCLAAFVVCSISFLGRAGTFEETKALAEQGDAGAHYILGLEYSIGESIEKDFDKALAWFHKAATWSSRCSAAASVEASDGF